MEPASPIVPLATLIGSTPEECRARGLRWWLSRALAGRSMLKSIIALREAAGIGLAEAKMLCGSVAAAPAGMEDVIARLERGDLTNAAIYLRRHYDVGSFFGDPHAPERVALALARAFAHPRTDTEPEVFLPRALEEFASAAGWSIDEARERGLGAWLEAMGSDGPSVAEVIAVRTVTGLSAKAALALLREFHADAGLAPRVMAGSDATLGALKEELAVRAECEIAEARALVQAFREAFGGRPPGK